MHGARDKNQIYLPRRRQRRISPALGLLDKTTPPLRSCVGGRRTRQTLRQRRGLFVVLLPVVLSFQLIFTPAMSREDSLPTAMLRSLDSKTGVSPSVRRQTSHNVHYVQAVQLLSERRYQTTNSSPSCPPPRVAPILQTGVRSRSFTVQIQVLGILSFPTCRKVMLFSPRRFS
ncbi:unnamed protein product [Brassica napus]|uniref:(rape) hypothetical protein n=1 Tax=Brassica napus TaxID=3708 RepID=A0A816J3L8_BRANA|nr:unnamed protein product [Brassica napus]